MRAAHTLKKASKKLNGVKSVNVNLLQNNMHVDFDETAVSVDDIINVVVSGGYGASVVGKKQEKKDNKIDNEISNMKFRLIVSLVCLVPLMYISMGHMWGWPFLNVFHGAENGITFALTQMLLTLPIMYVNRKYYITGFKTLFHGAPNMDSLIAIGSGAAFAYGKKAQINNPMVDVELKANTTKAENYRASGNIYGEVDFLKHFTFKAMFSMDYASDRKSVV